MRCIPRPAGARIEAARLLWIALPLALAGCANGPAVSATPGATVTPQTAAASEGARLFAANCASCHRYGGGDGVGGQPREKQSASELKGFASREWLMGLFDPKQVRGPNYFGATDLVDGKMPRFVRKDVPDFTPEDLADLRTIIIAISAEAGLPAQRDIDRRDAAIIATGKQAVLDKSFDCVECHTYYNAEGDGATPRLTGYGSREWLIVIISDPADPEMFAKLNDRMPAYGTEKKLTEREIGVIADWLRGQENAPEPPSKK